MLSLIEQVYVANGLGGLGIFLPHAPPVLQWTGWDNGAFQLRLSGPEGALVQVQYSEDLVTWRKLGLPVTLGAAAVPVSDSGGQGRRFYRALGL